MKNLLTSLFLLVISTICLNAQCPPGDVTLETQAEVIAFKRLYPNCTRINGHLSINGFGESDIHDLSPLSKLNTIDSSLFIGGCIMLESMEALNGLQSIGSGITIRGMANLREITFLQNFTELESLELYDLPALFNLDDLTNLESVKGLLSFSDLLTPLPQSGSLKKIGNRLSIYYCRNMDNLNFFSSLDSVLSISLVGCPDLIDIAGLNNIKSHLSFILLYENSSLNECAIDKICTSITQDSTFLNVRRNGENCNENNQVLEACGIELPECPEESIQLIGQSDINKFANNYPNCTIIKEAFSIRSVPEDEIIDLTPLSHIVRFEESFGISYTLELTDLTGLESVEYFEHLSLFSNDKLESLNGLSSLDSIRSLSLTRNNSLQDISNIKFANSGIKNITILDNITLSDISPISALDTIESLQLRDNSSLSDFNQLSGIKHIDILYVLGNNGFREISELDQPISIGYFTLNGSTLLEKYVARNTIRIDSSISVSSNPQLREIYLSSFNENLDQIWMRFNDSLRVINLGEGPHSSLRRLELVSNWFIDTIFLPSMTESLSDCRISNNYELKSIKGGNNLKKIDDLQIRGNSILENIDGFDHPTIINKLEIISNRELSDCQIEPLCLVPDYRDISISHNKGSCSSVVIALGHCPITIKNPFDNVVITSKADLDILKMEYPNADSIYGNLTFEYCPDLTSEDLEYFNQIEYIDSLLRFKECDFTHLDYFGQMEFDHLIIRECNQLKELPLFNKFIHGSELEIRICEDLISFKGLDSLQSLGELTLSNCPKVQNLEGFESLKSSDRTEFRNLNILNVDALLNLENIGHFQLQSCNKIITLKGLINLKNYEGGWIWDNDRLVSLFNPIPIDTLQFALWINNNRSLTEVSGFEQLKYSKSYIFIDDSRDLEYFEFPLLETINHNFEVYNNLSLKNFSLPSLKISRNIEIVRNSSLESIGNMGSVSGLYNLEIRSNPQLSDIRSFPDNLTANYIEIKENPLLDECSIPFICNHIRNGKKIDFVRNGSNCITEAVVENGCGYQAKNCPTIGYTIDDDATAQIYNDHYSKCRVLNGDLEIIDDFSTQPDFKNLNAIIGRMNVESRTINTINFPNLEYLLRFLSVNNTVGLESISFPKLNRFANSNGFHRPSILFEDNADLQEINTFNNLSSSNGIINIVDNSRLKSISGFNGSFSPLGIRIQGNDQLSSITGFSAINEIGTIEIKDNQELNDVTGFEYIFNADQLTVTNNPNLSFCSVKGFCHHIDNDRAHTVNDNDEGCNSGIEIIEKCMVSVVDQEISNQSVKIYPNPTSGIVNIDSQEDIISAELISTNGATFKVQVNYNQIDLNGLMDGIYWLRLKSAKNISTIKVIISKN